MGGGQPDTVTQTSTVNLNPQQQQLFEQWFPFAQNYLQSGGFQSYEGPTVAGFTPAQLAGQESALEAAGSAGQLGEQAAATHSQLLDPGFMLNPNQYLQPAIDSVTRQTTQNLMENILPRVRGESQVAGGQYSGGSTRQGIAEGQAVGRTSREISDAISRMLLQNYQQGLAGLSTAVGQTPQIQQMQLFPAQVMSAVGTQQQQMQQQLLNEAQQQFFFDQFEPLITAQQGQGLMMGAGYPSATTTAQGMQPQGNPLAQILGLGLTLASGGTMPFGMMMGK